MSLQPHGVETPNCALFFGRDQHGFADCIWDFDQRHYDAGAKHSDDRAILTKSVQVANEAGTAAANQFDMRKPRHIDVGGMLVSSHFDDPSARRGFAFSSPAEGQNSRFRAAASTPREGQFSLNKSYGFGAVNAFNARLHGSRKAFIAANSYAVAA